MRKAVRWSALALAATFAVGTQAGAQTFGFTGSIFNWTVPATGSYFVTAIGAQGGYGPIDGSANQGGRGARIGGLFLLNGGDILSLAVGGSGSAYAGNYNGGGGGGSFFVDAAGNPLLIAGGGGGVRSYGSYGNGVDASINPYATHSSCDFSAGESSVPNPSLKTTDLGLGGQAGGNCGSWGAAGAGFYGNGALDYPGAAAQSWANGLAGGNGYAASICNSYGGFGGGGSGTGCGGGGGGGGYSGGDGGWYAGGGGSWNTGTQQINDAGIGYGNGLIQIDAVSVAPEPASLTLMLTGLGFTGALLRRRKKNVA